MKKWLALLLASFTLASCSTTAQAPQSESASTGTVTQSAETPDTAAVTIQVSVEGEEVEGGNLSTEVEPGTILMDVMKEEFEIEETDGFISSINGHAQDEKEGKYWLYNVNGEMAQVGANDYELQDGDLVEFNLAKME